MTGRIFESSKGAGWFPAVTLVMLAVLAGLVWRWELEMRGGWAGLQWLGYFHWAVVAAGVGFVSWAVIMGTATRRWLLGGLLVLFAVPAYWIADVLLRMRFGASGPAIFASAVFGSGGDFGRAQENLERAHASLLFWFHLSPLLWMGLPLLFCWVCQLCGARLSVWKCLFSMGLFVLSWPIAVGVRMLFEERGGADFIHALKSGFVIPFLIIALGLPLLSWPQRKVRDLPE